MSEKSRISTTAMLASIAASAIAVGLSPALAHSTGASHTHDHQVIEVAQGGRIFSDEERRIIKDVLDIADIATGNTGDDEDHDQGKKAKNGKGKGNPGKGNKGLPPGIAMKLERGGTLPPGIAKRDLPDNLTARLPNRTDGAIRQIVGEDVLLIERGTEVILDIIRGAANN
jgi:hypothetical protein